MAVTETVPGLEKCIRGSYAKKITLFFPSKIFFFFQIMFATGHDIQLCWFRDFK